jgi:hypothetical protein
VKRIATAGVNFRERTSAQGLDGAGLGDEELPLTPGTAMHANPTATTVAARLDRVPFTRLHAFAIAPCALGCGFGLLEMMLASASGQPRLLHENSLDMAE